MSIFWSLKPHRPLPSMSGYSASPLLINTLISSIEEQKPKVTLELGSGVSTLIAAYCFSKNASGKIISLDHKREYADYTMSLIEKHELGKFVNVMHSPLTNSVIGGEEWLWYNIEDIENRLGDLKIDLVIIDGPPYNTQPLARYPALPILFPYLNDNAVIILDDASRSDEQEIAQRWLDEFPEQFCKEYIDGDRGTLILRRKPRAV
ncbi:MAG: class I SAM-dependent methyltransferase [Moorea sp. SIO2I5]|nr:class I SAM-dependent methyltransferase [Moorena sp. SIO2I5]